MGVSTARLVLHRAGVRHAFVSAREAHATHHTYTTYMARAGTTRNIRAHRTTAQTAHLNTLWQTAHQGRVHTRHDRERGEGEGEGKTSGAVAVEVSLVGS